MTSKNWQLANDAALRYETILVPAILGPFANALVQWALLPPNAVVVDVGCGTGAATRFAAEKLGSSGKVIGVDVNQGMLEVAQSLPAIDGAPIEWRQESIYDLTLADDSADVVLCAQSLQFMPERVDALRQMRRILKTGGSAYISLWCPIDESPYFDALVATVAKHINAETAAGLGSAFNLSDLTTIRDVIQQAEFSDIKTTVAELALDLPPINDFVPKHIHATPMGAGYDAAPLAAQQAILHDLSQQLADYQTDSGMRVPFRSYLIRAVK